MTSKKKQTFGRRLRHARENAGITRRELAATLGINQGTIYRWEIGTNNPSIVMVNKLVGAIGCELAMLVSD